MYGLKFMLLVLAGPFLVALPARGAEGGQADTLGKGCRLLGIDASTPVAPGASNPCGAALEPGVTRAAIIGKSGKTLGRMTLRAIQIPGAQALDPVAVVVTVDEAPSVSSVVYTFPQAGDPHGWVEADATERTNRGDGFSFRFLARPGQPIDANVFVTSGEDSDYYKVTARVPAAAAATKPGHTPTLGATPRQLGGDAAQAPRRHVE